SNRPRGSDLASERADSRAAASPAAAYDRLARLARRVADLCRCGCVARRSKIHEGYFPSSRLAAAANHWQRTRSLFMRWVLAIYWGQRHSSPRHVLQPHPEPRIVVFAERQAGE